MKFECSKCGACCRRAGMLGFMPQREDGACIHLDEDNTCKIYETRPEFCRVDKMAKKNQENISKLDYFKTSSAICNIWIKEDGLDSKYTIDIGRYGTGSNTA